MTDINELTAKLKAAAKKATPGQWVYLPSNTSIEYDYGIDDSQGSITYIDSGDFTQEQTDLNGEFIALANPANVLALTEALEAADRRNAELNSTLESWATDRAQTASELDDAEKRISQLESAHKFRKAWKQLAIKSISEREKDIAELTEARRRIASLEARTLTVKLPHWSGYTCSGEGAMLEACVRSLESQGFTVQIEGE